MMAAAGVGRRAPETPPNRFVRRGLYPMAMILILIDLAGLSLVTTYGDPSAGSREDLRRVCRAG